MDDTRKGSSWDWLVPLLVIAGLLVALFATAAGAHDPYMGLKQPSNGYSCCSGKAQSTSGDCEPVLARYAFQTWWAFVENEWIEVPQDKVLDVMSFDGKAHFCGTKTNVLCFIRPEPDV